jgi:hypothetical protein
VHEINFLDIHMPDDNKIMRDLFSSFLTQNKSLKHLIIQDDWAEHFMALWIFSLSTIMQSIHFTRGWREFFLTAPDDVLNTLPIYRLDNIIRYYQIHPICTDISFSSLCRVDPEQKKTLKATIEENKKLRSFNLTSALKEKRPFIDVFLFFKTD